VPQPIQLSGQAIQGYATASVAISANVTTTATTSGTATALLTFPAVDCAGGNYDVTVFSPGVTKGTTSISLELWVDGVFNQSITALYVNAVAITPYYWAGRVALVQGVHTLTVRGFVDAGTGTLTAGTGATGAQPNAVGILRPA
jgi:hypothetical protein